MQFRALVAAALAVGAVYAKNGPLHVVYPRPCSHVCGPVVTQSQGNCIDAGLKCICYQPHMTHLIPLCEACAFNQKDSKNGVDFYPCELPFSMFVIAEDESEFGVR